MKTNSAVLSAEAVLEVRKLYQERDALGRRVYSHMSLGRLFGVSETTIMRALKGYGAFMGVTAPKTEEELKKDAAESLQKLLAMQATPEPTKTTTTEESKDGDPEARAIIRKRGYY